MERAGHLPLARIQFPATAAWRFYLPIGVRRIVEINRAGRMG
jgi:hypothetical protein